ncbi:hypothetical protein IP84_13990, partial [beta proteobacterium AAP99]
MPYFGVPVYFTLQPGGTRIESVDGKPKAAILKYPNYSAFGPGHAVTMFDYDPAGRGWYEYGRGKVSADGRTIASANAFQIYQFSATSVSSGGDPPPDSNPGGCDGSDGPGGGGGGWGQGSDAGSGQCSDSGDPVDALTGEFRHIERDLYVPDVMPIDLKRIYRTRDLLYTGPNQIMDPTIRPFGFGMSHVYEMYLILKFQESPARIYLMLANGRYLRFEAVGDGTYRHAATAGEYFGAYILNNGTDFVVYLRDGRKWGFSKYVARLKWMEDALGNRTEVLRTGGYVTRVNSPNGRWIEFTYNAANRVTSATDNLGRTFTYTYDAPNLRLIKVTDPLGGERNYTWVGASITSITDPNGKVMVANEYFPIRAPLAQTSLNSSAGSGGGSGGGSGAYVPDRPPPPPVIEQINNEYVVSGRVKKQTLADGSTFDFNYYSASNTGYITKTEVTDRRGNIRRMEFNGYGVITKNTFPVGKPEEQVATFTVDPLTGRTTSIVDALLRRTDLTYDSFGNVTSIIRLAGTPQANTTTLTWHQVYSKPLTIKDANNNTTTLTYDQYGNLTRVTDALNKSWNITYDAQGKPLTLKDPLNNTTTLAYDGADLSSVTDPLNRVSRMFTDAVGRVQNVTDPLNNRSYSEYDALNRLTKITDALGGVIRFTYDPNGNLLTHVDQANRTTTYTYNDIGKVATKRDALNQTESFAYEPGGKLSRHTDRKGQVAGVTYDGHGRVTRVGFGATTANP